MTSRIKTIDYVRFIAVIMVVLGHCLAFGNGEQYLSMNMQTKNFLHNYIYSLHMPLFAVLSGWLFSVSFKKRSAKEIIVSRLKSLFLPIVAWQFCINVYNIVIKAIQGTDRINIISLFNYKNILGNMWFLWSILICSFLVIFIKSIFKDKLIVYIAMLCMTLLVRSYTVQLWLWLFPFFAGAYLFEKNKEKFDIILKLSDNIIFILLILIFHLFLVIFWKVDYYIYIEYGKGLCILVGDELFYRLFVDLYRVITGILGSVGIILLIKYLLKRIKMSDIVDRFAQLISKYSLGIYVFSTYMLNPILRTLPFNEYSLVANIIQTIIIIVISTIVIAVIDKIKIFRKLLLGR